MSVVMKIYRSNLVNDILIRFHIPGSKEREQSMKALLS